MYSPIRNIIQNYTNSFLPNSVPFKDHVLACTIFTLLGLLSASPWGVIPNVTYTIVSDLYDISYKKEIPIVINDLFIIIIVTIYTIIGGVRPFFLKTTCLIFGIILFIIPLTLQFSTEKSFMLELFLFLITVRFALYMGVISTLGSSIASILPFNYNGFISLGGGIAGVLFFGFYILAVQFFWPLNKQNPEKSKENLLKTIWFLFGIATFFCIIAFILLSKLMNKDWFQERIKAFWKNTDEIELLPISDTVDPPNQNINSDSELQYISPYESTSDPYQFEFENDFTTLTNPDIQSPRSTLFILKDCWKHIFNLSLSIWITFLLFPIEWKSSNSVKIEITFILFSDLLGRFFSVYFSNFSFISTNQVFNISLFRLILIPLSLLPFHKFSNFFDTLTIRLLFLMILFLSNGYILTESMINAPESVSRIKEKGKIATFNVLFLQIFITVGLYSSRLYDLIFENIPDL